jgi:plastocyanin
MQRSARRLVPLVLAGSALLAAAGAVTAADRTVTMVDLAFEPSAVEIVAGDSVTWVNEGAAPHDATGDGWATPLLTSGQSASVQFDAAGTYAYICSIHPDMTGQVVVAAASGGGGDGGGGGSDGGGGGVTPPNTDTVGAAGAASTGAAALAATAGLVGVAGVLVALRHLGRRRAG